MATDEDATAKAPISPAPASESTSAAGAPSAPSGPSGPSGKDERPRVVSTGPASERSENERINERLTERIRHGTTPPESRESRESRERPRVIDPSAPASGPEREDKLNETIRQRLEHLVPELVKKTFAAGMG